MLLFALVACHHSDHGGDGVPDGTGTPPTSTPADACAESPGEALCVDGSAVTCDGEGHVDSIDECPELCLDGACVACALGVVDLPYADPEVATTAGIHLLVDPAGPTFGRVPFLRPVDVLADGSLQLSGPVAVFADDGSTLGSGAAIHAGDRLLLAGTGSGTGTVTIEAAGCSAAIPFDAAPPRDLAGRPLDAFPWFETPNLFSFEDDAVSVELDPGTWRERLGQRYDVWVVPARDAAAWAADPKIADAGPVAGPVQGTVRPKAADGLVTAWTPPAPTEVTAAYSLVVDFGQDGQLDPGDLVDGYDVPGFYVSGDLSAAGPYTAESLDVSLTYWHSFMLYWPAEVDSLDPIPLVVISHGNGHDYHWYDYLGNHFASHGYAVIAHRNDTADTSIIPAATTTWENTDALLTNLDTIAGGVLQGRIDTHRIAWIGHSRGGEGVVMAYNWLQAGTIHPAAFSAADVRLVASIAPTTFNPTTVVNPADVPVYSLLAGSADGDVTGGVDSYVVEYYRIFQNHTGLQTVTYVHGATHNDFNCCGFADGFGVGPGPLIGRQAAQQIAKSYFLAELSAVFDGHDELWEYFSRMTERFVPPGVESPVLVQLKRAEGDRQVVIDDFQSQPDPDVSSEGEPVAMTVEAYAEGPMDDANTKLSPSQTDPFNGMTWSEAGDQNPSGGAVFEWAPGSDEYLAWDLGPDASDWSDETFLSFRVCQGTRHPYTVDLADMLSFTVEAEDAAGNVSDVDFGVYGGVPAPFRRDGLGTGVGWTNEFQTVRIPVQDFAADGTALDLAHVAKLRFRFGPAWGSDEGRVGLDDVMLLQEVLP